jgi:hypothetical protein
MKKIVLLTLLVVFAAPFANVLATSGVVSENTAELCSDSIDNDGNGNTDLQDEGCASFVPAPVFLENTEAFCTDGLDNDGDGNTDLQDEACSAFVPEPVFLENTEAFCTDGIDNNGNGNTDLQDEGCAAFVPAVATSTATTTPTTDTNPGSGVIGSTTGGGSSGGSSFGGGLSSGTPISSLTSGTPISGIATSTGTTTCAAAFKTFMKKGAKNDVAEVKKLQAFLNKYLGLSIPTTGYFGNMTFNGVKSFQTKYADAVLAPWGITSPTGYFFSTTQKQANLMVCAAN